MKFPVLFLVGVIIGAATWGLATKDHEDEDFHQHVDLAFFINGEQMDFSGDEFMSGSSCEVPHDLDGPIADFVHMHDKIGTIVHSHRADVKYGDFFDSVELDIEEMYANNETHELRFFINGEEQDEILGEKIRDLDRVLVTYGKKDRSEASILHELGQVTNQACLPSELCPHRLGELNISCSQPE